MTAYKRYQKRLAWFKARVGKKVYREDTTCGCPVCKRVYKRGLIIDDELHASYLCDIEADVGCRYFSTWTGLKCYEFKKWVKRKVK